MREELDPPGSFPLLHGRADVTAGRNEKGVPVTQVFVCDDDVNSALRVLKKKMQREGTFREMKRRRAYERPSERRVREKGGGNPPPP